MKLSLCIELFFTDLPIAERIAAASRLGYEAVEFWQWRGKNLAAMRDAAERNGVVFSAQLLRRDAQMVNRDMHEMLVQDFREEVRVAQELGTKNIVVNPGPDLQDVPRAVQRQAIVDALRMIGRMAETANVTIVMEPVNARVNHPGVFLTSSDEAASIIHEVGSPVVKMLFDIYHQQISEGDVSRRMEAYRDIIGHIHVAGSAKRSDPEYGELNYPFLMDQLRSWPYDGYVGLEFHPPGDSEDSARRAAALLRGSTKK